MKNTSLCNELMPEATTALAACGIGRIRFTGLGASNALKVKGMDHPNTGSATDGRTSDSKTAGVAETWLEIPYGQYAHEAGLQVMDREAAEAMSTFFEQKQRTVTETAKGLPVYVGHPDAKGATAEERERLARLYPDGRVYGRVLEVQAAPEAMRLRVRWTAAGKGLVMDGDAGRYGFFSPHWGMARVRDGQRQRPAEAGANGQGRKVYRPVELYSLGLTNRPNIPGLTLRGEQPPAAMMNTNFRFMMTNTKMTQLLEALGVSLAAEASEAEVETALDAALTALAAREEERAATNELREALDQERTNRCADEVEAALNEGRITQATREQWERNLRADFEGNRKLLRSMKPLWSSRPPGALAVAGNVRKPQPGPVTMSGQAGARVEGIRQAVERRMRAEGHHDFERAYEDVRREEPELFQG